MSIFTALTAVATLATLAFVLASLLVLGDRWLRVEEDPRVTTVERMLPATNCGGCGYPGCRAFAEALVRGAELPAKCSVSTEEQRGRIALFLGVETGFVGKRVARLACAGGDNVARNRARYQGLQTCAAAALVAGGGKACFWGCLGLADCEAACGFDAISMNEHHLPVVSEDRCTACGDCVAACPKDLFSLQAIENRLWVACASLAEGEQVVEDCEVGCTGCGRCAMDAPTQIRMQNHLPIIDYRIASCSAAPTQRCPTGAIVWLDPVAGPQKGQASRSQVIRHGKIHDLPS